MSGFETILFAKEGPIARITLNRPEARNAYSIRMRDELYEVLGAIPGDDEVRVVVLDATGQKAFCAGADLSEFLTASSPNAARTIRFERDVWNRFLKIPQPLIASIHGYCLGSGMEMALFCDLRVVADDTRFGLPELGLGIIPAAGGTQTLPRAIGTSATLEMLLTNRWIGAEEALRLRLINRVVPRAELRQRTTELAEHIAALDPRAVRLAKQAVLHGMDLPLTQGLELERRLASVLGAG